MINQKLIQEIENSKLKAAYINSVNKGFKNRHNLKYIRNKGKFKTATPIAAPQQDGNE